MSFEQKNEMILKTGLMTAENSALNHKNKLHITMYWNRKPLFLILITFQNITMFTGVLFKSMRRDFTQEHENITDPKLLNGSVVLIEYCTKLVFS